MRAATDAWSLMDVRPGSVVCWPTSLGWMMGPWLLFSAMLNGATVAMFQVQRPTLKSMHFSLGTKSVSRHPQGKACTLSCRDCGRAEGMTGLHSC